MLFVLLGLPLLLVVTALALDGSRLFVAHQHVQNAADATALAAAQDLTLDQPVHRDAHLGQREQRSTARSPATAASRSRGRTTARRPTGTRSSTTATRSTRASA
jgi:Flp pilus assembly protein TadG